MPRNPMTAVLKRLRWRESSLRTLLWPQIQRMTARGCDDGTIACRLGIRVSAIAELRERNNAK